MYKLHRYKGLAIHKGNKEYYVHFGNNINTFSKLSMAKSFVDEVTAS